MNLSVLGTIDKILPVESGKSKNGQGWKKQSFVIDTGEQYNSKICFSLFGDEKISLLTSIIAGNKVQIYFNASSREYNEKWYHSLDAWKIILKQPANGNPQASQQAVEDLPF